MCDSEPSILYPIPNQLIKVSHSLSQQSNSQNIPLYINYVFSSWRLLLFVNKLQIAVVCLDVENGDGQMDDRKLSNGHPFSNFTEISTWKTSWK